MRPPEDGRTPSAFTDAMLMALAAGGFAVCGYFLYFYYLTGSRQFSGLAGPVLYIAVPALVGASLIGARRLRPDYKGNLVLSLVSIGITVVAVELCLTLWFSLPSVQNDRSHWQIARAAQAAQAEFDTRTVEQVVDDLRQDGLDAVPSLIPQVMLETPPRGGDGTDLLPLAGLSNALTVVCNENGEYLTYTSDEHGFNNPPGVWQAAPVDVVAVGDSFTQGWCVDPARNYVSLIRERHPATVTLGMGGNGPLTTLAALREYGPALRPRTVLWFFCECNDLADVQAEQRSLILRRYLRPGFSQRLIHRQAEIDEALRRFLEEHGSLTWWHELRLATGTAERLRALADGTIRLATLRARLGLVNGVHRGPGPGGEAPRGGAAYVGFLERILRESKSLVEGWGGRLVFVYLPSLDRYGPSGGGPHPGHDPVLARAASLDLPVIDLTPVFTADRDPLRFFPFRVAYHYSDAGHALVGRTVLRHLARGGTRAGRGGSTRSAGARSSR